MKTREQWLTEAAERLRTEIFEPKGFDVPEIRVSLGFPARGTNKNGPVGQCWSANASSTNTAEVFLSPKIGDSPARLIDVLAHEMIHAMGNHGHRGAFPKIAKAIGLTGKMTATKAGPELAEWCAKTAQDLGPWPGGRIDAAKSPVKKQGTRLLKAYCESCGYTIRVTKKWALLALPSCPNDECEEFGEEMVCDSLDLIGGDDDN